MRMEKKVATIIMGLHRVECIYSLIMENHMEKKLENEMESLGPLKGIHRENDRGNIGMTAKNMETIIVGYIGFKVQV